MALAKYDLVRIWSNYRLEEKQKGVSKKVADSEFLTTYNTGLLYSKIFNILGKISIGALYRWKALLEDKNDWTVLIGNYNYTANGCYRTSLSENEIKIFLNILLSSFTSAEYTQEILLSVLFKLNKLVGQSKWSTFPLLP